MSDDATARVAEHHGGVVRVERVELLLHAIPGADQLVLDAVLFDWDLKHGFIARGVAMDVAFG